MKDICVLYTLNPVKQENLDGLKAALKDCNVIFLFTCSRTLVLFKKNAYKQIETEWERWISKKFADTVYLENLAVIDHLFKLASGIMSSPPGDQNIWSQIKTAFQNTHDSEWQLLFHAIGRVNAQTRRETSIFNPQRNLAHASLTLLNARPRSALIIGSGSIAIDVYKILYEYKIREILIVTGSRKRLKKLDVPLFYTVVKPQDLQQYLKHADVVFYCDDKYELPIQNANTSIIDFTDTLSMNNVISLESIKSFIKNHHGIKAFEKHRAKSIINANLVKFDSNFTTDAAMQLQKIFTSVLHKNDIDKKTCQRVTKTLTGHFIQNAKKSPEKQKILKFFSEI